CRPSAAGRWWPGRRGASRAWRLCRWSRGAPGRARRTSRRWGAGRWRCRPSGRGPRVDGTTRATALPAVRPRHGRTIRVGGGSGVTAARGLSPD
ncbi:MAG: hypothetical protein AVDCRST_MAG49-3811, partial [uncultured Thermomicrobiales bacterium]